MNSPFSTVASYVRSLFFNGLFALLPIALTVFILHALFTLIKRWLEPILGIMPEWLRNIPHIEIVVVLLFILLIGAILRSFLLNQLIYHLESIIERIPLVKPVYVNMKQLVRALTVQDNSFKKVVLVEFPHKGSYAIGFLTGQLHPDLAPNKKVLYNIFVPATPNPTSGFYLITAESDFVILDLTRQEAMTLIMSGGIITPARFNQGNQKQI